MTEEQIKQNAEEWVKSLISEEDGGYNENDVSLFLIKNAFIAGAHSRDEEIERIKNEAAAIMDEACALKTELDKLRNPWISVEERLPEKTKGVFSCQVRELEKEKIVYYKDERGYIHTGYLNANNHWRDLDRDNTAIYTVTHWMPIP